MYAVKAVITLMAYAKKPARGVGCATVVSARYGTRCKNKLKVIMKERNSSYLCKTCERFALKKGTFAGHWLCTKCGREEIGSAYRPLAL